MRTFSINGATEAEDIRRLAREHLTREQVRDKAREHFSKYGTSEERDAVMLASGGFGVDDVMVKSGCARLTARRLVLGIEIP